MQTYEIIILIIGLALCAIGTTWLISDMFTLYKTILKKCENLEEENNENE